MDATKVTVREVGPRDGFQNIAGFIPTQEKVKIVDMLTDTGVSKVQVSSFVHPKWIPQLADAQEVFTRINKKPGVEYNALIPNERGLDRAIQSGVKSIVWVISATDSSNKENLNMTTDESLAVITSASQKAKEHGITITGDIANALGCPFEGDVPIKKVIKVVKTYRDLGVKIVSIADSIGNANPEQVKALFTTLIKEFPDLKFSVHLHDILGIGLANAYAAYEAGVTNFDAAIAGLGGCPYALHPGGNIATENLVNMFEKMDVDTGIDLDKLLETSRYVRSVVGESPMKQEGHPKEV